MEKNGVYIDKGPQDYEIIQRNEKNCADVCLEGHYVLLGHEGKSECLSECWKKTPVEKSGHTQSAM